MNEIIKKLLSEFSALISPINPLILKEIFDKVSLNDELHSSDFNEHFELLTRLKQLSQDFFNATTQSDALNQRQNNFTRISGQKETVNAQILELENNIAQLKSKLLDLYKLIETKTNESLLSKDPLAKELKHTQYDDMKTMISGRSQELSNMCKDIDERKAKSSLVLLLTRFNTFAAELKNAEIDYSDETNAEQAVYIAKQVDIMAARLSKHYTIAEQLQKAFAQRLSVEDLQLKHNELETESSRLTTAQESLLAEIKSFQLDEPTKIQLNQQFDDSPDKSKLISSYRSRIDSRWDYINPLAWASWSYNILTTGYDRQKHGQEQLTLISSVAYLELLDKQYRNATQQEDTEANKILLEKAMPEAEVSNENPENREPSLSHDKLINKTTKLFKKLHSFNSIIDLQDNSPEADYYLTLLLNMPFISDEMEKKKGALVKLHQLIPLYGEIERLRTENGLLAEHDHLLPNLQTAEQDSQLLRDEAPLRENYQEQLNLCGTYQYGVGELASQELTLKQSRVKLKQLQADLRRPENKAPNSGEIDSLKTLLSTIQETVIFKFNQLTALAHPLTSVSAMLDEPEHHEVLTRAHEDSKVHFIADTELPAFAEEELVVAAVTASQPIESSEEDKPAFIDEMTSFEENDDQTFTEDMPPPTTSSTAQTGDESQDSEDLGKEESNSNSLSELLSEQVSNSTADSNDLSTEEAKTVSSTASANYYSLSGSETSSEKSSNTTLTSDLQSTVHLSHNSEHLSADATETDVETNSSTGSQYSDEHECQSLADHHELYSLSEYSTNQSEEEDDDEEEEEEEELPQQHTLSPVQINLINIKKWHNEAKNYILAHDNDTRKWYAAVYQALKELRNNESSGYKVAHVIRDVLFELEHRKNSSTLDAYRRLCPNPEQDINKLLALKPALLITESSVSAAEQFLDCPPKLKKHYDHYNSMKAVHPIEAELFLQAVRSVHVIINYMELPDSKIAAEQIPALADDPRYEPLKRHRGFLQIWEMLEDLCRFIIGKISGQQEHEYTKRPCFFNTRSNQLISEAGILIQELLPLENNCPLN